MEKRPSQLRLSALFSRIIRDERGAETMEWVLIGGLIIVATITTIAAFGTKVMARWTSVNAQM